MEAKRNTSKKLSGSEIKHKPKSWIWDLQVTDKEVSSHGM